MHDFVARPGFIRCLAAVIYDLFLVVALWFVATALILPFNAGQAFNSRQLFYPVYLLIVSFLFHGWFWTHGGQTLGQKAWKIKVLTFDYKPINWLQALLRFSAAIVSWSVFGLGFLWMLVDKDKQTWHDYLSKTKLFVTE
ncbi:RDD family protein [Methylocucumis oryzae]|uniref:RDD family protein n=1 Tax=Methylocucumis oryzae TaxID=1632867 RepID=UPI001EF9E7A5|nr:RDD family protein [Methylocucumis oryzae]